MQKGRQLEISECFIPSLMQLDKRASRRSRRFEKKQKHLESQCKQLEIAECQMPMITDRDMREAFWFEQFWALGPERTLKELSEMYNVSYFTLRRYSSDYGWKGKVHSRERVYGAFS